MARLESSELAAVEAACQEILEAGSKSFAAAGKLLPPHMRAPAAAVYAICRVADDLVDEGEDPAAAVEELRGRLDRIYAGTPDDHPADRGFSAVARAYEIPREVPDALVEGFVWDAEGRRYQTIDELEDYCARVASTVGIMMTLLMGPRDPETLTRAADLGLAMQLTNIARDVGEDARNGRLYIPMTWLRQVGIEPEAFLADPKFTPALGRVIRRLLETAEIYYRRADAGISWLPRDSRLAIRAARLIYSEIGREIADNGYDSVSQRAFTSRRRKALLLARSARSFLWRRRECRAAVRPATRFLVEARAT